MKTSSTKLKMTPKEIAIDFLTLASSGKVDEAYDMYIAANFTHHNQYFPSDRESLKQGMIKAHKKTKNKVFKVHQAIQEVDKVMTYSRVQSDAYDVAVVHIFRFDAKSKIVEMWDVGQQIVKDSLNKNGAF